MYHALLSGVSILQNAIYFGGLQTEHLVHENALLKRRLYGSKTERSHAREAQLALGDLLAAEAHLQKALDAAVAQATEAAEPAPAPKPPAEGRERATPKGRRDLLASNLPRCLVEILDEELEARAAGASGSTTAQLMFRRGGFAVLVKRAPSTRSSRMAVRR